MAAAAVVPIVMGLAQMLQGYMEKKKADGMVPQVSPIYAKLMADYQRRARNSEVGSAYNNTLNKARNLIASSGNSVLQTGNPMAFAFAQRRGADYINELLAGVAQNAMQYTQMAGAMGNKMSDIQFQSDTNRWANKAVPAQQNMASGIQNMLLAIQQNAGGGGTTQPPRLSLEQITQNAKFTPGAFGNTEQPISTTASAEYQNPYPTPAFNVADVYKMKYGSL